MDRREFLKKSIALGLGAGALLLPEGLIKGGVTEALAEGQFPDLVALRGPSPEAMFERGIAALGGMGRFVKPGQDVVVKPNISFDVPEEMAANTSSALVARVIRHCLDAGAARVHVLDHSIAYWESSLEASGIGAALTSAGGVYARSDNVEHYRQIEVSGTVLKTAQIHELLTRDNVLINVPVLKHHGGTRVSIATKNLMGCVWDRRAYHRMGLDSCIADFLHARKPDLNVVDAFRVVTRNGPRGGSLNDVVEMRAQILSPDIVAADAASARMLDHNPSSITHIRLASEAGFGQIDLTRLNIERIVV